MADENAQTARAEIDVKMAIAAAKAHVSESLAMISSDFRPWRKSGTKVASGAPSGA
jgi:hypothetical protein